MATAYTSLLGLALPVTGELSGSWGDTINTAITSLLDTAVAGTTSITTDADITLSTTTGIANQARQAIILWNPASGTVTRNITAPAQSKIYTVINASGGTQSIVFRGAGPTTGVTIIKGESAVVAWNGTDFIKVSNTGGAGSFTNVTISGTTTLSGLTASTALALDASKNVVSVTNTGTGNNVLSASPTLTGTVAGASLSLSSLTATRVPFAGVAGLLSDSVNMTFDGTRLTVADLADSGLTSGRVTYASTGGALVDSANLTFDGTTLTAAGLAGPFNGTVGATTASTGAFTTLTTSGAVTHNAGTANGVAYLNGSKVLTTGSALTFDGTNLTFNSTGQRVYAVMSGSTLSNRLYFQTSVVNAQTSFSIIPNGTNRQSQYVSYNANDPANASRANIGVDSTSAYFVSDLTGTGSYLPITFSVAGSEQMRLTSTGLGIGTSSPNARLAVVGGGIRVNGYSSNSAGDGVNVQIGTTGGVNYVQSLNGTGTNNLSIDANQITFRTGSYSTAATLDPSGNLGLGVTPSAWRSTYRAFDVGTRSAFTDDDGPRIWGNAFENSAGTSIYKATGPATQYYAKAGFHAWFVAPSGTAGNAISFTQAMALDASGNLGIGTSSPVYRLHLAGNGAAAGMILQNNSGAISNAAIRWQNSSGTFQAGIASYFNVADTGNIEFLNGSTTNMMLSSSGNLGLGVTPSAWAVYKSFDSGSCSFNTAGVQGELTSNGFFNASSQWIYKATGFANRYVQNLSANGVHAWYTAPSGTAGNAISFTQAMTLDASGNLGLGTTTPDVFGRGYGGTVLGISGASQSALVVNSGTGNAFIEMGVGGTRTMSLTATSSSASIGAIGALPFIINTNGTERARIDSSGNLLVGTTSSSDYRMRVDAPANNHAGVFVGPTAGYASLQVVNTAASGTRNLISFRTAVGGSQVGAITTDGTNTTYSTSSDYRLKNITGPITTSGAYIDSLNPVEGTWKADGSTFVGLIAHEVQEASRTTVATGVKDGEEMQGMDYSSAEIIANLIAEVKSLRQRLAAAGI